MVFYTERIALCRAEITKILVMLDDVHTHLGLTKRRDAELTSMMQKTDLAELQKEAEKSEL